MNISNLIQGQTIKNYKSLCTILDIPVKGGNGKDIQLNELSRYCTYIKQGNKFIITEIFNIPLVKIDHRKEGNNSKYVEHIKYLLLNKLSTCDSYKCTFTKNNLFEFLGMVNPLYLKKTYAKQTLTKQDDRIRPFDINHFYMRSNDKMTRILFDSLNSLKNQFLIEYREVNIIVRLNNEGDKEHTEATEKELIILLEVKRRVLLDMGLNSMIQVIFKFKTEEFYKSVTDILKEEYDIEYSYKQFELLFAKDNIIDELLLLESKEHKRELNNKVIDIININANNTYNKNLEEYDNKLEAFINNDHILGKQIESNFKLFRHRDDYIDIQLELAEYLLRID